QIASQLRTNLARINTNGTVDVTFNPNANGPVYVLSVQRDGKMLVGGAFSSLDGQPRSNFGRLNNTTPINDLLGSTLTTVTWYHGGAAPEVWRAVFDISTNGVDQFRVIPTRISDGWQVTGIGVPINAPIRARGFISGSSPGSVWYVEQFTGRPF